MHPKLHAHYQRLGERYDFPGPLLEVGASAGGKAILAGRSFGSREGRFAINLNEYAQEGGITFIQCNSNDMRQQFADGQFGTVISNAVIEHDKYFWKSIDEMKRVLKPGGYMVVGAPGFVPNNKTQAKVTNTGEDKNATVTYAVHCRPDYWRFSVQAFREVICEGLNLLETRIVGDIPRVVVVAQKPE